VPSFWEEPMGGVALQLLAAGRAMIVSKNGGLREVVGAAGLSFTNGNVDELYAAMKEMMDNDSLKKNYWKKGRNN
jgi:glycosyltransferase involved in cell wall biosynthesis